MAADHATGDDAAAIARSLGEPERFRVLFERHFDAVWRYLRHRCGSSAADDLASETFVRAFASRARFRDHGVGARPWLLGIAANVASENRRGEERRLRAYARSGALERCESGEDDLVARLAARAHGRRLAEALSRLSANDRETLLLAALGELRPAEIAAALGVAEATVRVRLFRVRSRLSPFLDPGLRREGAVSWKT